MLITIVSNVGVFVVHFHVLSIITLIIGKITVIFC